MADDDRRTYGLVWVALRWAAAALQQTDRVMADFEPVRAAMSSPDARTGRVTAESQRAEALFWADVHFLVYWAHEASARTLGRDRKRARREVVVS